MQLAALLEQQAVVRDLLRQALAEAVLVVGEQALAVDDAAPAELGELAVDVDLLRRQQLRELAAAELAAEHGGDLHHALRRRAEPVEPRGDHLAHRAGDEDLLDRTGQMRAVARRA